MHADEGRPPKVDVIVEGIASSLLRLRSWQKSSTWMRCKC
uniref:Uncharacterized protein n=1 Tax=Echinococcus granulosus TaxID=6210 RepID=A0A068WJT5_ECHGR|nr:hypothetical protein EgrG_001064300 [Echinococcus granulosus]